MQRFDATREAVRHVAKMQKTTNMGTQGAGDLPTLDDPALPCQTA